MKTFLHIITLRLNVKICKIAACILLLLGGTISICNATPRTWVGYGSGGSNTQTDFNAGANWSPAGAPAAGDVLTMNITGTSSYTVTFASGATTVNIGSLTINYTASLNNNQTFTLNIPNGYTLNTSGNFSVTNAATTSSSTKYGSVVVAINTIAVLNVGGNLNAAITVANRRNLILFNNYNIMGVTGNSLATNLSTDSAQVVFNVGNSPAVTTFNGDVTLDDNTSPTSYSHKATLALGGIAANATGTFILYGNLNLGRFGGATTTAPKTTILFLGTNKTITSNLANYYFALGNWQIGNGITPTNVNVVAGPYSLFASMAANLSLTISNNATLTLGVGETISSYTFWTSGGVSSSGTLTIGSSGVLNVSDAYVYYSQTGSNFPGGYSTYTANPTSTVFYNAAANQTVFSGINYGNLTIANTGSTTATAGGNLTVVGNALINSGSTLAASTFSHQVAGNWTNNGNFTAGSSSVTFNGSSLQTVGGAATTTFNNLTINNPTNNVTLSLATNATGNVLINSGSNLLANSFSHQIGGNFTNSGTFNGGTSTVSLNGTSLQTIGGTTSTTFNNLNINNAANVLLGVATNVANTFNFTTGSIDASNYNLTLNTPVTSIAGASASSYVITGNGSAAGFLQMNNLSAATIYNFPVGSANYYLPASLTTTSGGLNWMVNTFNPASQNAVYGGTPFSVSGFSKIVNEVWNILPTTNASTTTATITLNWNAALEGTSFTGYADAAIGIAPSLGGVWQNATATAASNTTNYATQTFSNNYTGFLVSGNFVILPTTLLNFNAHLNIDNTAGLSWSTSQETNLHHFEIQRSNDGNNFSSIGKVLAKGNSATTTYYNYNDDSAIAQQTFYRLKMIDINGNATYSYIIAIKNTEAIAAVKVYPNPAAEYINVSVNNNAAGTTILLINPLGQVVQQKTINNTSIVSFVVSHYLSGRYYVQIKKPDGTVQTTKVLIAR